MVTYVFAVIHPRYFAWRTDDGRTGSDPCPAAAALELLALMFPHAQIETIEERS